MPRINGGYRCASGHLVRTWHCPCLQLPVIWLPHYKCESYLGPTLEPLPVTKPPLGSPKSWIEAGSFESRSTVLGVNEGEAITGRAHITQQGEGSSWLELRVVPWP